MNQRVMVSVSAVALVAVVAGGAALAVRSGGSSHTPKTIMVQGAGAAAESAKIAADTASGFAMPNQSVNFVLSGDLPALDGSRNAWQLAANPTADLAKVAALAKTFGLEGDVNTVEGGWQVGDPQGAGPNLFVNKSPGLPWYFSNYANMKEAYACAGSAGIPPDAALSTTTALPVPTTCPEPAPPTGVPTKDEALAKTADLLKALGIDTGTLTITANASEWSADVQAVPSLDGIAAPGLTTSFGFGGEGKLQYANGFLVAPEKADNYPLIGTTKAFDSLKAGGGFMGGYGIRDIAMSSSGSGVAYAAETTAAAPTDNASSPVTTACALDRQAEAATGTAPSDVLRCAPSPCTLGAPSDTIAIDQKAAVTDSYGCGVTECVGIADTTIPDTAVAQLMPVCAYPDPMPVEPTTPPEPVTITITGVHETLLSYMGADGSMWLVPGYEFTSADGGTWPVLAIDESFVNQVAPTAPIPENATTGVAIGGVETVPPAKPQESVAP